MEFDIGFTDREITPWLMNFILILNVVICLSFPDKLLYQIILLAQILFYLASTAGNFLESRKIKIKILFIPFYFSMMNYAAIA